MLTKDTSIASLAAALVFCAVVATSAVDARRAMVDKASAQASAVDALREWKRQYDQLIPVEELWHKSLGKFSDAKDILTIHGLVSENAPGSNADTLLVEKIERLVEGGKDLGAQKVCINSGGAGWSVSEDTFNSLIKGMQALTTRVDMDLGTIAMSQEKGRAQAVISNACLLLRDADNRDSATTPN
jgi:hypothetical protein